MRLIDADRLKAELLESAKWHDNRRLGYYSAVEHIDEQPTAYDIDKVVERLEAELYKGMESLDPVLISFNFGINKAIEIVKRGAV